MKKNTKKASAKAKTFKTLEEWWVKAGQKKAEKIEKKWLKDNEPNDEDEGGDHWHVNEMMHSGDAIEMLYEKVEEVWNKAAAGEPWEMNQCDSLYCDLDGVIMEAYEAAKSIQKKRKI